MKRFLPAAAALWLAGCGYVGDPLPPLANIPERVSDLAAIQCGSRVIVQFTMPAKTTEGHPIPQPQRLDLRVGTAEHFDENQWAASALQIPPSAMVSACESKGTAPVACPTARYEIAAADWTGKEVIIGVRAVAGNRKQATWSNFVVVPVVAAPEKPTGLSTTAAPQGVRLAWTARGTDFRVFRKSGDAAFAPVSSVQAPEWIDTEIEFGKAYTYQVQTIAKLANDKVAESELSAEVSITPRDVFPPAAPKGVQGSAAPNSIELNWEPNGESDLAGYRIYRAEANGAFEKIADSSAVPSYSDRKVEHGKTYRYAVIAVDQVGNESPRSTPVDVILP